jgi:hypothetical protein
MTKQPVRRGLLEEHIAGVLMLGIYCVMFGIDFLFR